MTDRVRTLTVVLENDTRTDDVRGLRSAIGRLRGVESVELGEVVDPAQLVARVEARRRLGEQLLALLQGR